MNDLSPDARAVLDAARSGDEPTDADQARLRRALLQAVVVGAAGAAGAAGAKALAGAASGAAASNGAAAVAANGALVAKGAAGVIATASTSAAVTGKIVAAIVLAGAIGSGALSAWLVSDSAPEEAPPAAVRTAGAKAKESKADSAKETTGAAPSGGAEAENAREPESAAELEKPSRTGDRATADGHAAVGDGSPGTLEAETRVLRQVRAALQAGKAEEALSLLDSALPAEKGELHEERAAARILALCKLGRATEAEAAAARFVRESPRSPLVDRVKSACSGSQTGTRAPAEAPPAAPEQGDRGPARPSTDAAPLFEIDTSPPFDGVINE